MLGVTIMELKVSPKVVSQSGEKRFENTGSSRSSNTDLQANRKELKRQMSLYSDDKKNKTQDMREIISANDSCWSARGGREGWGKRRKGRV